MNLEQYFNVVNRYADMQRRTRKSYGESVLAAAKLAALSVPVDAPQRAKVLATIEGHANRVYPFTDAERASEPDFFTPSGMFQLPENFHTEPSQG